MYSGSLLPPALAELGWMTMAIVDTMMVVRQHDSAVAIGAVSLGSILFNSAVHKVVWYTVLWCNG